MLVHNGIGSGVDVCVGCHVRIEVLRGAGDVSFPESLVVEEDQSFKIDRQQILFAVQLPGLDGHGQRVGQKGVGIQNIGKGRQDIHGHEGAQNIVGVEIHVGSVGRIAAVELQLVGHVGFLFEPNGDAVIRQRGVDLIRDGLHNGLAAVVPDGHGDGLRRRGGFRRRSGCGLRGGLFGCRGGGGGLAAACQNAEAHSCRQQQGNGLFHRIDLLSICCFRKTFYDFREEIIRKILQYSFVCCKI